MDIQKLLQETLSSLPAGTNVTINIAQPGAPIYNCVGGVQFTGTSPMKSKNKNSTDSENTSNSTNEEVVIIDSVDAESIVANDSLNQAEVPFETVSTQDNSEDYESTRKNASLLSQAIEKNLPHSMKAKFMAFTQTNNQDVIRCINEACELAEEGEEEHIITLLSEAGMAV